MASDFRSLSALLLGASDCGPAAPAVPAEPVASGCGDPRVVDLLDRFVVELTRLTARAAERLEEQVEALLADLAQQVLGRELRLSPAEVEALLADTLAEFGVARPLVVRVSSADAPRLAGTWPVEVDAALAPGDFTVDVEDGTYDLRLATRLAAMLASHRISL